MGAVPELDLLRIRKFCEGRIPPELRSKVRVEVGVRGKSVTLFECRPPWDGHGMEWTRQPISQLRFDRATARWTLHWADRNSRWHLYDFIDPGTVGELLAEIDKDPTCIFWG
ncbi:MAG TPA: DUF3024 domain-containing protein [Acidimicrobiales bacterium]